MTMTESSNIIPVEVLAHLQLWTNFCNNQFVRNTTAWEAGFPSYGKESGFNPNLGKTFSKLLTNQKFWVTYKGARTAQLKCLQCSYVKIMFSVVNKDADKDVNVTDQLWEHQASVVPGSSLSDCPCATSPRVTAPQLGAWQLCEQGLHTHCSRPRRFVSYRAGPTWVFKDS